MEGKGLKKVGEGGPRYHHIWFKTSTVKDNCLVKLLLGDRQKENLTFHHLRPTHTQNIKLALFSLFCFIFFHLSLTIVQDT